MTLYLYLILNKLDRKLFVVNISLNNELFSFRTSGCDISKQNTKGPMHQYYSQSFIDQISFVFFARIQIQSNNDEMVEDH